MLFATMQVQLLLAFVLICITRGIDLGKDIECVTPNQENATCIPLKDCAVINAALLKFDLEVLHFLEESKCGSGKGMVCCGALGYLKSKIPFSSHGSVISYNPPPKAEEITLSRISDETVCGLEAKPSYSIKGGFIAQLEDFPWLVALEYESKFTNESVGIRCGGSLINNRYVLTAAHCIVHVEFVVIKAWLGVTNITSDKNCLNLTGKPECVNSIQKLNVKKEIVHQRYHSTEGNSDIGLLQLEKSIQFTDYIRPICLPSPELPLPRIGLRLMVAGWGFTENNKAAEIKLKLDVPVQNTSICNEFLKMEGRSVSSSQLCIGGEKGKDSCQGDSGGPLMKDFTNANQRIQWYQEAIVSYGVGCGVNGRPAIYSRVSSYVTWISSTVDGERGAPCVTPNLEYETCVPLRTCKVIIDALKTQNTTAKEFADLSQCGYDSEPLVCCGSSGYPTIPLGILNSYSKRRKFAEQKAEAILLSNIIPPLPEWSVCGIENIFQETIYRKQTKIGQFPWLVALEYKFKATNESAGIKCGGSLINERYVLTAASCIIDREIEVNKVWLGAWNISSDLEADTDRVLKLNIENKIPHPFYRGKHGNDIGLLKLEQDIEYTDYIRPICLPSWNIPAPPPGTNLTVAGWGATENGTLSDIKLKVEIQLFSNVTCKSKLDKGRVNANQLCAGCEEAKDCCQGDSGGPLMRIYEDADQVQWYQEGIISYSVGCSRGPAIIYTRVSRYINWIIYNISDEDLE